MDLVERLRSGEDGLEYAAANEIELLLGALKSCVSWMPNSPARTAARAVLDHES